MRGWMTLCVISGVWLAAESSAQMSMQVVSVVPARQARVRETVGLVGSVEPVTRSVVASEVQGVVESLPVEEGDWLEAGEVICELRKTTRQLAYEQAEATVKRLQEELAELEAGSRKEEIDRARARLDEAKAIQEKWESELKRVERLRETGSAAEKEINDAVSESAAARARVGQTQAEYDLAVAGPRQETRAQARFAVEAARVAAARLKYDLDQTTVRAPFSGYVTKLFTEVGEWISDGGNVVEMIDLQTVLVRLDVPEDVISAAKVGQRVSVMIDALGQTVNGRVKHIVPQANVDARTFPVEIEVENGEHLLKGGMFARARVPSGPEVDSVIVPRDALIQRGDVHYVVMVGPAPPPAEGTFAMPIAVGLGADLGDWMAVDSPMLQAGVPVAVKAHDRIYAPTPVQTAPGSVPEPQLGDAPTTRPADSAGTGASSGQTPGATTRPASVAGGQ